MKLAPLLTELQPQGNGLRRAERTEQIGIHFHVITIIGIPTGFRLIRTVTDAHPMNPIGVQTIEKQDVSFPHLSELFTYAKKEGFFQDVAPYASGWRGYSEWKRITDSMLAGHNPYNDDEDEDDNSYASYRDDEIEWRWQNLGKNETAQYDY